MKHNDGHQSTGIVSQQLLKFLWFVVTLQKNLSTSWAVKWRVRKSQLIRKKLISQLTLKYWGEHGPLDT